VDTSRDVLNETRSLEHFDSAIEFALPESLSEVGNWYAAGAKRKVNARRRIGVGVALVSTVHILPFS
jgi:hypothetical protein